MRRGRIPSPTVLILLTAGAALLSLFAVPSASQDPGDGAAQLEEQRPLLVAAVVPPVKSRFNAILALTAEAVRRNHTVKFYGFEGTRSWVPAATLERPNFVYHGLRETATANNATLFKWQLEEFSRLSAQGGFRNLIQAEQLKVEFMVKGLAHLTSNFTEAACGDDPGRRADVAVVDLTAYAVVRKCQAADVLVAMPNAQVITNIVAVRAHITEPTLVSQALASGLDWDTLRSFSLAGTVARLKNAAALVLVEWSLYPLVMGFVRHGIFFPMTIPEIEGPREVGPLVRYVGPFVDEGRQLPDLELDAWISAQAGGVVLVSMGTILSGEKHISAVAAAVLHIVDSDAGVTVLWAAQAHQQKDIPADLAPKLEAHPRVRVQGHLPQLLVLKNGNVRLFITHGGHNSVHEGVYYGKPLVVVPGAIDQHQNAACFERAGVALIATPEAECIAGAAAQVLANSSFARRAAPLAKALKRAGGAQAAMDLVETMMYDYGGDLSSLTPNRLKSHWLLQWGLDVVVIAAVAAYALGLSGLICCRLCWRCCRRFRSVPEAPVVGKDKAA